MNLHSGEAGMHRNPTRLLNAEEQQLQAQCDALHQRAEQLCYSTVHKGSSAVLRNSIASDLHLILSRVVYVLETGGDATDVQFADAALRVVQRVAKTEKIELAKSK